MFHRAAYAAKKVNVHGKWGQMWLTKQKMCEMNLILNYLLTYIIYNQYPSSFMLLISILLIEISSLIMICLLWESGALISRSQNYEKIREKETLQEPLLTLCRVCTHADKILTFVNQQFLLYC